MNKTIFKAGGTARVTAGEFIGQYVRIVAVFADVREANVETLEGTPDKIDKISFDDMIWTG